jgi:hypothetical protein
MRTGVEKGRLFRELHERRGILILPNPWDASTAKLLASVGFEALATSSLDRLRSFSRAARGGTSRFQRHESARARPKKPTRLSSHTRRTKSSALSDIVSLCR